jgi:hypothetical protein
VSVGVTTSHKLQPAAMPKTTRKRLKKEILSDDFKKRKIFWKIFRTGKFSMENFSPHITKYQSRGVTTGEFSPLCLHQDCSSMRLTLVGYIVY